VRKGDGGPYDDPDFMAFYIAYDHKHDLGEAYKIFTNYRKQGILPELKVLLQCVASYQKSLKRSADFTASKRSPARWLRNKDWMTFMPATDVSEGSSVDVNERPPVPTSSCPNVQKLLASGRIKPYKLYQWKNITIEDGEKIMIFGTNEHEVDILKDIDSEMAVNFVFGKKKRIRYAVRG
jgi:hypothetical protein